MMHKLIFFVSAVITGIGRRHSGLLAVTNHMYVLVIYSWDTSLKWHRHLSIQLHIHIQLDYCSPLAFKYEYI